jgi:type IV pilus assembly protein PilQ
MNLTARSGFSTLVVSSMVLLLGLAQPNFATADSEASAPAPVPALQLGAVRAAISSQAAIFTLEISGEFTYSPRTSGEQLVFVDLPGVVSTRPPDSHLLPSDLVSSYRVVPYFHEGQRGARLEVLLKQPVKVSYQKNPGALQVTFVSATGSTPAAVPGTHEAPPPAVARAEKPATTPLALRTRLRTRGNAVENVTFTRDGGKLRVLIRANGAVEYRSFRLENPPRLVVDIPQTVNRVGHRQIRVGMPPLQRIRVAQFRNDPPISRVVMDLDTITPYKVHRRGHVVEVELQAPGARTEHARGAKAEPAKSSTVALPEAAVATANLSRPAAAPPASEEAPEVEALPLLDKLVGRLPVLAAARPTIAPPPPPAAEFAVALDHAETAPLDPANAASATLPTPSAFTAGFASQEAPAAEQQPPVPMQQEPVPGPRYTGEPISVNLKDVDLKDFFRLMHEISGLNVVLDPAVSGRVTIVLEDVLWDQALDIVLRNNGLDKQLEGNVLRIARRSTLQREEEEVLALEQARQQAVERVTVLRTLNYARSALMTQTLSKFRSPRGEIISDERTNTLIIADIPQVIPVMDDIIRQLDQRSVQVQIEARIVAASRGFARELGAQFGFLYSPRVSGRTVIHGSPFAQSPLSVTTSGPSRFQVEGDQLPLFSNFPAAGATTGLSLIHRTPSTALDFIISAAETKSLGKLLSKPTLITQNNVEATVQQGLQIPIQTTINNTISVQLTPVTLQLTVRPQVTDEGTIFLTISVSNNTIAAGIPRINGIPALTTQQATTEVLVENGGTVVFGGVIQNQSNLTIEQVPLLGSIPIIGHLFKRTGVSTETSELLFFITPKIV